MASTVAADKDAAEYAEIIDDADTVRTKVLQLAALMRQHSGRVVFVTGAGISTGAGIPDFRSGLGSATGMPAGKWTQKATAAQWTESERSEMAQRTARTTDTLRAVPTPSHMALVALHRAGVVHGLISQNCDGLHRRSGFDPACLAELHGNGNLEYCSVCGTEYLRDFRTTQGRRTQGRDLRAKLWATHHSKLGERSADNPRGLINPRRGNHYTGRRCSVRRCGGYLFDSTVDFGDNLPTDQLTRGEELAAHAGLVVVLGSRCAVSPACDLPLGAAARGAPLVVVNLQRTEADHAAHLRIGCQIDDVMIPPLMRHLGLEIPEFRLRRTIRVEAPPKPSALSTEPAIRAMQLEQRSRAAARLQATRDGATTELAEGQAQGQGQVVLKVNATDEAGMVCDYVWAVQATFVVAGTGGSRQSEGGEATLLPAAAKPEEHREVAAIEHGAAVAVQLHPVRCHFTADANLGAQLQLNERTLVPRLDVEQNTTLTAVGRSKGPRAGESAEVVRFPWSQDNVGHPGRVTLGKARWGRTIHVVPTVLDVSDSIVLAAERSGRKCWVATVGTRTGSDLSLRVPMPEPDMRPPQRSHRKHNRRRKIPGTTQLDTRGPLELQSLTLLFRAHYGEVPLPLPLEQMPRPGAATDFVMEYFPSRGQWQCLSCMPACVN